MWEIQGSWTNVIKEKPFIASIIDLFIGSGPAAHAGHTFLTGALSCPCTFQNMGLVTGGSELSAVSFWWPWNVVSQLLLPHFSTVDASVT